jgi:sugar/nucleoside kinase (ribokinase family)
VEIPSFSVNVADTVGAGDAFDAGLIAGVLEDLDLRETGRKANAVAALTCRGVGPLRTQPDPAQVETLLKQARS